MLTIPVPISHIATVFVAFLFFTFHLPVASQELVTELKSESDAETILSPKGQILLRINGERLVLFESSSGSILGELSGGNFFWVFHPEDRFFAAASRTGQTMLWNLETGRSRPVEGVGPTFLHFSSDGNSFYSGFLDGNFIAYDLKSETPQTKIETGSEGIYAILDGAFLFTGSREGKIHIYDLLQGDRLHTFQAHNRPVKEVHLIDSVNRLISIAVNGEMKYWDADPGRLLSSGSEELKKRAAELQQHSEELKKRASKYLPPPPGTGATKTGQ